MTLTPPSIEEEARDCRAAWAAMPKAKAGVHIHHEVAAEKLTEPIENRIAYILSAKPKWEQALRLRLMRPLRAPAWAEYEKVLAAALSMRRSGLRPAEYEKVLAPAHRSICPTPDCPWDGESIFGGAA